MKSDYSFFMYCRKSTEDSRRQIASIGDQIQVLEQISKREKLNIVCAPFIEEKSAKNPGRPVFNEMLKRIKKGEANALFCWDVDRLSRNPIDNGELQWLLQNSVIKVIKTPSRSFYPEDAGLLMSIEGGRATDYVLKLSRNVKRGLFSKAQRGWRPNGSSIGYINVSLSNGERIITEDEERFPIVRKMFDYFLTGGYSVNNIRSLASNEWGLRTRMYEKSGGKPLAMSHVYKILKEPFYYGYYEWKDPETGLVELLKGKHKPMITQDEYKRVQLLLGKYGKPQPKKREFAFTGLLKCGECNSTITAEEKHQLICSGCKYKFSYINKTECPRCKLDISEMTNPTILNYTYYHCTKRLNKNCSQKSIKLEELEEQVLDVLKSITIEADIHRVVVDYLNENKERNAESEKPLRQSLQAVIDNCVKRLANLKREYVSVQNTNYAIFTEDEFIEQKRIIFAEQQEAEKNLDQLINGGEDIQIKVQKFFNFCANALVLFKTKDLHIQRIILKTISSNLTLNDKKLILDKYYPFVHVENILKSKFEYSGQFEPENSLEFQEPLSIYWPYSPILLSEIEAIRNWMSNNPKFDVPDVSTVESTAPD